MKIQPKIHKVLQGDSLEVLKTLSDSSIEAVVTDPPYGLGDMSPAKVAECLQAWARGEQWTPKGKGFMGKQWDAWVPPPELWREVLRVLKPGGHAIVFAGSRTQDLMSVSLRLAGFEVRDTLQWLYGSGFPKSLDVSKALDKRERAEPAQQWQGWGTALKPAYEPAILARKPLDGTVAQNTLAHGCGGLNLDACRVGEEGATKRSAQVPYPKDINGREDRSTWARTGHDIIKLDQGRFPANVILDEDAAAQLDAQTSSTCSRFFYTAKASRAEREAGLGHLPTRTAAELTGRKEGSVGLVMEGRVNNPYAGTSGAQPRANTHPTVKPIALMRYLVKLVTPQHGTVLDPFTGSGSTGCAATLERVNFVGVELDPEYAEIARTRIKHWASVPTEGEEETLPLFEHLEPSLSESLRDKVLLEPDHELHQQSANLLAEINKALEEARAKQCKSIDKATTPPQ